MGSVNGNADNATTKISSGNGRGFYLKMRTPFLTLILEDANYESNNSFGNKQHPRYCARCYVPAGSVMHTSRVSSSRHSASRGFFCLETASLYSSPTRLTRLLPQLIFHCATVFYAPRRHARLLARPPHSPTTLDSPRARLAASCASLGWLALDPAPHVVA
jgi:hypothetical protein